MNKRIGKNDMIFIGALLALSIGVLLLFSLDKTKPGGVAVVTVDGEVFGRYSLMEEQRISIRNERNEITNTLVIKDGVADMVDAVCPDRLCVHQKAIDRSGESIVCLPNRVVVTIENTQSNGLDGFVR